MIVVLGGLAMCFWLLLICVIGITNGPVGLVVFYKKEVKDRVIQMGLSSAKKIRITSIITVFTLFVPLITFVPAIVCYYEKYFFWGVDFWKCFWEILGIYMIMNLFDLIFIDGWWIGHAKVCRIKGTKDLRPYINVKMRIIKWIVSFIIFPLLAYVVTFALLKIFGGYSYFRYNLVIPEDPFSLIDRLITTV